ncbi:MAG: RHS repeat domain-containing protein [Mangrovibacterium sp.]
MQYYYHADHLGSASYITNVDGEVVQHIEYVPFGEVFIEERNNTWNTPFLFNGKELDEETGLYYYGARYYNPRTSIFYGCDPLMEDYPSWSPYHYCHNNPVNLVDPTGMEANPIYDENGDLLGTDDLGLQGDAIVMNKSDFKQGMSHAEAMEKGNTLDNMEFEAALDFANNGNFKNFLEHYNNLDTRPDWDGYLTLSEANEWYRNGEGQPLFLFKNKIKINNIDNLYYAMKHYPLVTANDLKNEFWGVCTNLESIPKYLVAP